PVAALVEAVSDPPGGGSWVERKARLREAIKHGTPDAAAVFAADKVAKVRELRMGLVSANARPNPDKLAHYEASLALLEHKLANHALVRQLRFELEALELLPPHAAG